MASKTLYDHSIDALGGGTIDNQTSGGALDLGAAKGKVCLIENVAGLCGTTRRDYLQLNGLVDQFGSSLVVFGFPCNQFFRQSQDKDFETLALLKHVRPGEGYEPKFAHSTKIDVNGANEHAIFTWLKDALPTPVGPGSEEVMGDHTRIAWDPVRRSDITWNFEKFLVNQNGVPVKRYSKSFETKDIAADIQKLIDGGADALSA